MSKQQEYSAWNPGLSANLPRGFHVMAFGDARTYRASGRQYSYSRS